MKRLFSLAFITLAGLCAAGSLHAQNHEIRAKVPFDFVVSNQLLPAGDYEFIPQSNEDFILIRNRDRQLIVIVRNSSYNGEVKAESDLVFNRYGNHYFLNGIHCTSIAVNAELPISRTEKRAQHQLAQLSDAGQTLIALK
jgi:hypothetical protein